MSNIDIAPAKSHFSSFEKAQKIYISVYPAKRGLIVTAHDRNRCFYRKHLYNAPINDVPTVNRLCSELAQQLTDAGFVDVVQSTIH